MTNQPNPSRGLKELCDELKSVVEKYKGADQPEVRKSATSFGKIIDHVVNAAVTQGSTSLAVTTVSGEDLMAKQMSASPHEPSAADRDINWAVDTLSAVLRSMLRASNDQGAHDLIKAVGVTIAGVAQVIEDGGTGHTLVLAQTQNGNVLVQAQKVSEERLTRSKAT